MCGLAALEIGFILGPALGPFIGLAGFVGELGFALCLAGAPFSFQLGGAGFQIGGFLRGVLNALLISGKQLLLMHLTLNRLTLVLYPHPLALGGNKGLMSIMAAGIDEKLLVAGDVSQLAHPLRLGLAGHPFIFQLGRFFKPLLPGLLLGR